jgi:hypothetical protein
MIGYDTRSLALGDDITTQVEFDFLITKKSDLLITITETGEDPIIIDGDDTTYLSSVVFDPVEGGGTVTLLAALATGKTLYIDLNVVEPDQPNVFRVVNNYLASFRSIERALDYIVTQIQTLARRSEQSLKFARHVDTSTINMNLPEATDTEARIMQFNGTAFSLGATANQIANAEQDAIDAETAKVAAQAARLAAEAARDGALAAAGSLTPYILGRPTAYDVVAGTGIDLSNSDISIDLIAFVQGSGGSVTISANPQFTAPETEQEGMKLRVIGCSDSNRVSIQDGNGLVLNMSEDTLVNNSIRDFVRKDTQWVLVGTNNI